MSKPEIPELTNADERLAAYQVVVEIFKSHVETLRTANLGFLGIVGALCAYVGKSATPGAGEESGEVAKAALAAAAGAAGGAGGVEVPPLDIAGSLAHNPVVGALLLVPLIACSVAYGFCRSSVFIRKEQDRIAQLQRDLGLAGFPPTLKVVGELFFGFALVQWIIGGAVLAYFLLLCGGRDIGDVLQHGLISSYLGVVVVMLLVAVFRPLGVGAAATSTRPGESPPRDAIAS